MIPSNWPLSIGAASIAAGSAAAGLILVALPAWDPMLVGALIGVLSWFTFLLADRPLGISAAYAKLAGLIGLGLSPARTESLEYYRKTPPRFDWEVALAAGVVLGGFLSAWTGGELTGQWLPPLWRERFGPESLNLRLFTAILGGALIAFGARLAGGCTSGHGISGTMQLSVGSWIALLCFFAGGVPIALLLFGN